MTDLVLTYSEAGATYVYEHPSGDGAVECLALVLLKCSHGIMAAVPVGVFTPEELQAGEAASMEATIGPSRQIEVSGARIVDGVASPVGGASVSAVLVDLVAESCVRFLPLVPGEEPELLVPFDSARPDCWPDPSALLQVALSWVQAPDPE